MKKINTVLVLSAALCLVGCSNQNTGTLVGATSGALIGGVGGPVTAGVGLGVGAVVGTAVGTVFDQYQLPQAQKTLVANSVQ